jgi:hypothetical protein
MSSANYTTVLVKSWGTMGDVWVSRNYDADGKTDIDVHRPSSGT